MASVFESDDYECEGQINIFEYLASKEADEKKRSVPMRHRDKLRPGICEVGNEERNNNR